MMNQTMQPICLSIHSATGFAAQSTKLGASSILKYYYSLLLPQISSHFQLLLKF